MHLPRTNRTLHVHQILIRQMDAPVPHRVKIVMPGAHWENHKRKRSRKRSRTCPNRTRSCPKRIGSVHREKPPPFCERSANVLLNETKRKKLSSVQLCCHIHGTLLPYVAILPVIGDWSISTQIGCLLNCIKCAVIEILRCYHMKPTCYHILTFVYNSFWIRSATFCYV